MFLPYLTGGGAPHQREWIKGALLGITLAHNVNDVIRSIMEGVVYAVRNIIEIFEEKCARIKNMTMIGGGCMNRIWRQIATDVIGKELRIPEHPLESAGLGIAIACGIGTKLYKDYWLVKKLLKISMTIRPNSTNHELYSKIYSVQKDVWRKLDEFYRKLYEIVQT